MKRNHIASMLGAMGVAVGILIGCHANPDDPAGQAEELEDPVRRENAIANLQRLYTQALAAAEGDRSVESYTGDDGREKPGPKAIADASIEQLVATYTGHPEDSQNGERILNLLLEMQDVRAMPAFLEALEWRSEVSEQHAIIAAQAIERMDLPEDQKGAAIEKLSEALDRVQGSRGIDNRMRIHFIRALGDLNDTRATPILTKVATRLSEDQNFLINRMAAEEIGRIGDPEAVDDMIKALFLFAPNQPQMRMNDVAAQALVQIGRPALEPLVALLNGDNEQANRIANNYIEAIRRRDENAAAQMDPRTTVVGEACYALGQLGFREAIDPMMGQISPLTEMSVSDAMDDDADPQLANRAHGCVVSLVSINRADDEAARIRQALIDVYNRVPKQSRMQLLVAMQHTFDPGLLDFLHEQATTEERELPDIRVLAVRSYAFLANREEARRLQQVIDDEPGPEEGGFQQNFRENAPALATAEECHEDLDCYVGKLGDDDPMVVRKAAYMIARYGRGNAEAAAALIPHIDHRDQHVRGDVLYALDWVATEGSPEAVAKIDEVRETEEGRSSWNQIKELAMAVRARLQTRAGDGG
jgi:HEAT repeat protein